MVKRFAMPKKHFILDLDETIVDTKNLQPYLTNPAGRNYLKNNLNMIKSDTYSRRIEIMLHRIAKHHKLTIYTNSPEAYARAIIKKHSLPEVQIIGNAKKPNKELLEKIIEGSGIHKQRTYLIGDSAKDILNAHQVSIVPIGVTWGYSSQQQLANAEARKIVNTQDEFLNLLSYISNGILEYQPRTVPFDKDFFMDGNYDPGIEHHFLEEYFPWNGGNRNPFTNWVLSFKKTKNFTHDQIESWAKEEFFYNGKIINERYALKTNLAKFQHRLNHLVNNLNLKGKTEVMASPNSCPHYCYKTDVNNLVAGIIAEEQNYEFYPDRIFERVHPCRESHSSNNRNTIYDHLETIGIEEDLDYLSHANNLIIFDDIYTTGTQAKALGIIAREKGFQGNIHFITLGKTINRY